MFLQDRLLIRKKYPNPLILLAMKLVHHYRPNNLVTVFNAKIWRSSSSAAEVTLKKDEEEEEFRVLDIMRKSQRQQRKVARRADVQPDRGDRMATDQNWGNVWPGPKTFHPSSVPLPLRQGYVPKGMAPPGKKANAELMKVPNFLHLTPPVIKAQCEAIKSFCTEWPKQLNSEEAIEKHYPQEIITSDYCHASPSIRNPLARIVTLRIKLSSLNLDKHARDKFIRLVGDRYDDKTDLVTITADRCPLRKQNLDYVNYLLTALYHESWNVEDWEKTKTESDMEYYDFNLNQSKKNLINWYLRSNNEEINLTDDDYNTFDVSKIPEGAGYVEALTNLMNKGESDTTLKDYGSAVRKLLGLPEKV